MKKLLLSIAAAALFCSPSRADEGMWIPMLIGKNIEDMKAKGFRLSAEDVYSVNNASLKDAIVHFGGGCTGEMISANGLLITNHHCGYGNIADVSTVEKNYLEDGFWAKSMDQEIPAPGLTVKFLVNMEDVTDKVIAAQKKKKKADKILQELIEEANKGGQYSAQISNYFGGNQYILLTYEVFTDVRLVGTPPKSLGKYGGDTDNWMWPRHTADFSMFRVYANKDNKPAKYAKDNVPYKPKKFLPVNIQGVENQDYAMIMGYPGRTNRYETSYGVDMAINEVNPSIVNLRDARLAIMRKYMRQDKAVNLKLASNYASIANYWKYFIGQTEQLKRLNVISDKQQQEEAFNAWAQKNSPAAKNVISEFSKTYAAYRPYAKQNIYLSEGIAAPVLTKLAARAVTIKKALEEGKKEDANKAVQSFKALRTSLMEGYVAPVDEEILAKTMEMYYNDIPSSQQPTIYNAVIFKKFPNDKSGTAFTQYANYMVKNTFLLDEAKFNQFVNAPNLETLNNDPAVQYMQAFMDNQETKFKEKTEAYNTSKTLLAKEYIAGLMQMNPDKNWSPDANSTMRVTYGNVAGYEPQDAVKYDYYTTMEGLLAKYKPGDYEFDLPKDFLTLAHKGDFGQYANADGKLVTCFITNNDITGGNSGSPIISANGELLGLAFDGNWEAMSGDIAFDKQYKRTIAVDIRFVLWIVDRLGGAKNLIDEMKVVK
ncbi:MAG: serine protease [Bacteroidetes bacterium 43-16]|nr:MAG: serine protease [Bacteroidetes bacterium 43-16]